MTKRKQRQTRDEPTLDQRFDPITASQLRDAEMMYHVA